MATLQNLLDNLKNTRETANRGPSFIDGVEKQIAVMEKAVKALGELGDAVKEQVAYNKATEKLGKASDVQKTIQSMLKAQIDADRIEQERHKRMMDVAERLMPQVTEEELKAVRYQQLAYQEHQKTLKSTLDAERKRAEFQMQSAQVIADRQIAVAQKQMDAEKARLATAKAEAEFAKQDKYGTISSAVGGLGSKAQDPLSKFLVAGLGRYVKERKEAPVTAAINKAYDDGSSKAQAKFDTSKARYQKIADASKARYSAILASKEADIQEAFNVKAAREHIIDPGSAAKLYASRDSKVAAIANNGGSLEAGLLNGTLKPSRGKGNIPPSASVVSNESNTPPRNVASPTTSAQGNIPVASVSGKPNTPPRNAVFTKASKQSTTMATPANNRNRKDGPASSSLQPVMSPRKTPSMGGMFGGKGGFLDIGGIAQGIKGLAGGFTKFLGPWGLVANSLMSFDRLVPIVSDGAGALMDLTKLTVPMLVSSMVELGNIVLSGFNGLMTVLDKAPLIGSHWLEKQGSSILSAQTQLVNTRENEAIKTRLAAKKAVVGGAVGGINTTSSNLGSVSIAMVPTKTYTDPTEARTIMSRSQQIVEQTESTQMEKLLMGLDMLPDTLKSIQQSVLDAANNPGSTSVVLSNPQLTPWHM